MLSKTQALETVRQAGGTVGEQILTTEEFECQYCGEDCGGETEPEVFFNEKDCFMPYCENCKGKVK